LGIDSLEEFFLRFGLGTPTEIELPGEKRGLVPGRGWKQATTGVPWQKGETLITGIGQGYLLVTPLQLALMTARIANGGLRVQPKLIRAIGTQTLIPEEFDSLNVSQEHIGFIQNAMNAVSNEAGGTALRSRVDVDGLTMAGKTGTAQVRRISRAERLSGVLKNEELPWKYRDHALFIAFAPVSAPRYAISVVVEHGGSGSRAAAPIAKDVMQLVLERDPSRLRAYEPSGNLAALKTDF
jgi:penicillin-binding protein 2